MSEKSLYTRSVERALDILECFLHADELSLHQIAEQTSLSDSTALRLINSLQKRQYLHRDTASKRYSLGSKFQLYLSPSHTVGQRLIQCAYFPMQELFQLYNENVQIYIMQGDSMINLLAFESTQRIHQPTRQGDRTGWNAGAVGRIFLAYQPQSVRSTLDPDETVEADSIAKILEDGYTLSVDVKDSTAVGIAAPVFGKDQALAGVLQLSGPASRFINEMMIRKIQNTVKTARRISQVFSG